MEIWEWKILRGKKIEKKRRVRSRSQSEMSAIFSFDRLIDSCDMNLVEKENDSKVHRWIAFVE